MHRFIVLLAYTLFIVYLHISGKLSLYINLKYSYISKIALISLTIMTLVELYRLWEKGVLKKKEIDKPICGCGNHHEEHCNVENKNDITFKQRFTYRFLLLPIVAGFLLPVTALDSSIVESKGFNFPFNGEGEGDFKNQFLQPNTSLYFSADDYKEMNEKGLKEISKEKTILLEQENYLRDMETIYNGTDKLLGKEIEFDGFVFDDPNNEKQYVFLLRFGVIHCIADSGAYGFLVELPKGVNLKNDTWIRVKGKIDEMYYPTVKRKVPLVKVTDWKKINTPKNPYVSLNY